MEGLLRHSLFLVRYSAVLLSTQKEAADLGILKKSVAAIGHGQHIPHSFLQAALHFRCSGHILFPPVVIGFIPI